MKKVILVCVAVVLALLAGVAVHHAEAAPAMPTTTLAPITGGAAGQIWPVAIAVDSGANVYVADDFNGKIYKFDPSGALVASAGTSHPTAVAIDNAGRVLVVNNYGKALQVFNPDLTAAALSLTGSPALYAVQSITVDPSTGDVFLADANARGTSEAGQQKVYRYDSSLVYQGVVPFAVRKPYSLAFDTQNDALCIGDRPYGPVPASSGTFTSGDLSRIVCVDPITGVVVRTPSSSSNFGYAEGNLSVAAGLAVDPRDGNVFAADPAQFAVLVYDSTAYTTHVRDAAQPMRTVNDVVVTGSGAIYVSSLNTHDIKRFADSSDGFTVSASLVWADLSPNGPSPEVTMTVTNHSSSSKNFTCSQTEWLVKNAADCAGGVQNNVAPGASFTVRYTVNTSHSEITTAVPGDTVYASALIGNGTRSQTVLASATTSTCSDTGPSVVLVPGSASFTQEAGRPPVTPSKTVSASVNYCTAYAQPELSVPSSVGPCMLSVNNSVQPREVTVSCDGSGLSAGDYNYQVLVSDTSAGPTPPVANAGTLNIAIHVEAATPRYIAVSMGAGPENASLVKVLNEVTYSTHATFTAFDGATVQYGARPAMGNVDGGSDTEIIVAKGEGAGNNAEVKVFKADGTPVAGANIIGYSSAYRFGARVAAGNLDGDPDGIAEVLVGTSSNHPYVRVFSYDGSLNTLVDTGLMLDPGFTGGAASGGVNIAAMDLNGDGRAEILTASSDKGSAPQVKAWTVNTAGGMGAWTASAYSFPQSAINGAFSGVTGGGASVAANKGLIALGSGLNTGTDQNGQIRLFKSDGSACGSPINLNHANIRLADGIELSVGDVDNDNVAEVLVSGGANSGTDSQVFVYNVDNCNVTTSPTIPAVFAGASYGARTAQQPLQ